MTVEQNKAEVEGCQECENADYGIKELNDERTLKALTRPFSVVSTDGTPIGTPSDTPVVLVVSNSGESYRTNVQTRSCSCPDDKYNIPSHVPCKHVRRARIAMGLDSIHQRVVSALELDIDTPDTDSRGGIGASAPGPIVVE